MSNVRSIECPGCRIFLSVSIVSWLARCKPRWATAAEEDLTLAMTGEAAAAAVPTSPPPLSADDLSFFVREGYLIKRGVLDPSQCAAARDALWAANASSVLRRDAPDSWRPIAADDESTDMMNYRKADQWRLRGMCSTSLVLDMFP
jgi:hypothetical protein